MKNKLIAILAVTLSLFAASFAAETVSTDTLTVTTQVRTWRVQIFTDFGTDPRIEFLREKIMLLPDNTVLKHEPQSTAARTLSAVLGESVTLANGKTLTAAELAEALAKFGDKFAAAQPTQ